jgi:putative NADPH-quinone reductase
MRILIIHAHPDEDSYVAAVHRCAVEALTKGGHEVDDYDLYAEGFQPVMSRQERRGYFDVKRNQQLITREVDRLLHCEGLVFVFPTWWYGMPAILKGYFDRVWVPGVAFEIVDGRTRPLLNNISRVVVISTYGSPWWLNKLVLGDPVRKVFMRGIKHVFSPKARMLWIAQYGLDQVGPEVRERFVALVSRKLRNL